MVMAEMANLSRWATGLVLCLALVSRSSPYHRPEERPSDKTGLTKPVPQKDDRCARKDCNEEMHNNMTEDSIRGTLVHHQAFPSGFIRARPVDVWLPEGYDPDSSDRYPVIYMHDGQFLFDHATSPYSGMDFFWDVDKTMSRLIDDGEIKAAIVVSVWMADWAKGARGAEYMPQKAVTDEVWQLMKEQGNSFAVEPGGETMSSDNYLRFLVHELKPFIDEHYLTISDHANTFVMGSSMGGLISAYAVSEYPEVFGGAACLSTHWVIGDGAVVQWLAHHWPAAGTHRLYFDHGTETFDASYEPYQQQMDEVMRQHQYTFGEDWITRRFEGADHSPRAWRERLHIPLTFLLGTGDQK